MQYLSPTSQQLFGLGSALIVIACFAAIGAWVGGRSRYTRADIFVGWGLVTGAFTVAGVMISAPFSWLVYVFWLMAALCAMLVWRREKVTISEIAALGVLWRILVLGLPLLLLVSAMKASQWDEFSQWLPNANYLFHFNGFPRPELSPSSSAFPAYPYAGPLMTYLVSRLSGLLTENAGGMANTLMLLCFAPIYLDLVGRGLGRKDDWKKQWGIAAFGILGVTVLSTVFVQKLVFTAYADTPTGIVLAVLGILVWKILENLAGQRPVPVALAWQFSFVSALFINLKQANLFLFVLLLAAALLVALRDPAIKTKRFLSLFPRMLALPVIVYLAWRYHVGQHMNTGEFLFMPYENWHVGEIFKILARMFSIAAKKGFYFIMMGAISVYAIWATFRFKGGYDRLAILVGGLFIGYNLVLWGLYVTAFDIHLGPSAGGFWRYNTQLGIFGCTTAAYGLATQWRKHGLDRIIDQAPFGRSLLGGLAIFLVLIAPFTTGKRLRFDIRPQKDHMRMVGQELAGSLPEGARLAVIDPEGDGLASAIMRYELISAPGAVRNLRVFMAYKVREKRRGKISEDVRRKRITHAWVHQVLPGVREALGLDLEERRSHLLEWTGTDWRHIKSWFYDGYDDPWALPD